MVNKKNIILCADGTGNRGGETPDTNVYRMYEAVERHQPVRGTPQITFYDNGVGTSTNKFIKALTGALGLGFGQNIRDLHEFLARNYNPGDSIYLFGFSRGAATVRAFAGMLEKVGLVDRNDAQCKDKDGHFDYEEFIRCIKSAFDCYRRGEESQIVSLKTGVKFMGVWDTVSALGFPQHHVAETRLEAFLERPLVAWILRGIDRVTSHNRQYHYEATATVDHVYHAIAIDDERKSFLPMVWDERLPKKDMQSAEQEAELERYHSNINQVWFTGMHSDVGGSYNQTGLAYVTMEWMMVRAQFHGLDFIIGSQNDVASKANSHGKLHDSRNGPAVLYRYAPRDIGKLCTDKGESIVKSINIHESVLERMDLATARYAAGLLPESFTIVGSGMNYRNVEMDIETGSNNDWTEDQSSLRTIHTKQRRHYRYFADACFLLLAFALYMWWPGIGEIAGIAASPTELSNHLGQVAYYFTPQVFDPFIKAFIVERPLVLGVILIGFGAIYLRRRHLRKAALEESIKVRDKVMARRNEIVSKLEVMTE